MGISDTTWNSLDALQVYSLLVLIGANSKYFYRFILFKQCIKDLKETKQKENSSNKLANGISILLRRWKLHISKKNSMMFIHSPTLGVMYVHHWIIFYKTHWKWSKIVCIVIHYEKKCRKWFWFFIRIFSWYHLWFRQFLKFLYYIGMMRINLILK